MAIDQPPQTPQLMPHNPILIINIRNASKYRDDNEQDEQQGGGNYEDVGNLLTQNQQTAMAVPLKTSANSAKSELLSETTSENLIPENLGPAISGQLAEVAKWY